MKLARHFGALTAALSIVAIAGVESSAAATRPSFPQAGVIRSSNLVVRAAPSRTARPLRILRQFRTDFRPTEILAVASAQDKSKTRWLKISLPMRPNGRYGWVRASLVDVQPVTKRIVVSLGARTLSLYDGAKLLIRTRVAVGRSTAPTPRGRFYVQAGYRPTESYLGAYAFETSAYSKLSDWPGGGIVGIHGWNDPSVLGKAVSSGCIRVSNTGIRALSRQVKPGTPITIKQ
ncbi:MAG: L,D-transpeptidase [Actinobacteria bacterium]|nr:L,D-transpeptidase [Actinomycetota bacterium]